jgi:hypothetical protein
MGTHRDLSQITTVVIHCADTPNGRGQQDIYRRSRGVKDDFTLAPPNALLFPVDPSSFVAMTVAVLTYIRLLFGINSRSPDEIRTLAPLTPTRSGHADRVPLRLDQGRIAPLHHQTTTTRWVLAFRPD